MKNSLCGVVVAFIAGAAVVSHPQIIDFVSDVTRGEPSYLTETAPEAVAPVNGLAIYAEKTGLAFDRSADRPDDRIIAAILEGDAQSRNITRERSEFTTKAGTELRTTYTVDVLLQERLYYSRPDEELIYSVECTYDEEGTTSRVMHRNLGEAVEHSRVSAATYENAINPVITDLFCEELMEKPEMPVSSTKPKPEPGSRLKEGDSNI